MPAHPQSLLVSVLRSVPARRATVHVAGDIDLDSVAPLREALDLCLRDGIRTVRVDVRGVTFCDVTGLNVLLSAARRAASAGGTLTLWQPSPQVVRLLELTTTIAYLLPAPGPPFAAPGHALSAAAGGAS
ncbi:STAS domain-containing protein [Kitasatospora sp. NPDC059571]|uniref:STAS domain-containing protein n=1 Tax=Kitasatospora sp. NPDC059571 TaxID=3346871 RepID=UPI0036AFCBF2